MAKYTSNFTPIKYGKIEVKHNFLLDSFCSSWFLLETYGTFHLTWLEASPLLSIKVFANCYNEKIFFNFHACYRVNLINSPTAYLLVCGRAVGPRFGRNQTIVLEGHIDDLGIASEYTIRSKLYEIVEMNLKISVPYRNEAEYDIWMTEERPSHPCKKRQDLWNLPSKIFPSSFFLI